MTTHQGQLTQQLKTVTTSPGGNGQGIQIDRDAREQSMVMPNYEASPDRGINNIHSQLPVL